LPTNTSPCLPAFAGSTATSGQLVRFLASATVGQHARLLAGGKKLSTFSVVTGFVLIRQTNIQPFGSPSEPLPLLFVCTQPTTIAVTGV
jgi:hypothetical protein